MNIVIVDRKNIPVTTAQSALEIGTRKVPFALIDTLLVVGETTLRTSDITKITDHEIAIVLLAHNYTKSAIISSTKSKSAELKLAQYARASTLPLPIAKMILRRKITTHIEQLRVHETSIDPTPWMDRIEQATNLDALLGIEGSFSRRYFEHFFALFPKRLHKGKRSKRPPLDPLNALLSFYYTLMYHLIAVRLISFGFEPGIGFLHRPFRAHYALASDILEMFRAEVNAFVYEIFADEVVAVSDFTRKGGVYLRYEGRKKLWKPFRDFYGRCEPDIDRAITEIRGML